MLVLGWVAATIGVLGLGVLVIAAGAWGAGLSGDSPLPYVLGGLGIMALAAIPAAIGRGVWRGARIAWPLSLLATIAAAITAAQSTRYLDSPAATIELVLGAGVISVLHLTPATRQWFGVRRDVGPSDRALGLVAGCLLALMAAIATSLVIANASVPDGPTTRAVATAGGVALVGVGLVVVGLWRGRGTGQRLGAATVTGLTLILATTVGSLALTEMGCQRAGERCRPIDVIPEPGPPSVRASSSMDAATGPEKARDGQLGTHWNAGHGGTAWWEIDLGSPKTIVELELVIEMTPDGRTVQRVLVAGEGEPYREVHRFDSFMVTGQTLSFAPDEPLTGVRFVRIHTIQSIANVAWREVRITAQE